MHDKNTVRNLKIIELVDKSHVSTSPCRKIKGVHFEHKFHDFTTIDDRETYNIAAILRKPFSHQWNIITKVSCAKLDPTKQMKFISSSVS